MFTNIQATDYSKPKVYAGLNTILQGSRIVIKNIADVDLFYLKSILNNISAKYLIAKDDFCRTQLFEQDFVLIKKDTKINFNIHQDANMLLEKNKEDNSFNIEKNRYGKKINNINIYNEYILKILKEEMLSEEEKNKLLYINLLS